MIKTLIFDFGDVFINLNKNHFEHRSASALAEVYNKPFKPLN